MIGIINTLQAHYLTDNVVLLLQGEFIYNSGMLRYFMYKKCWLNCGRSIGLCEYIKILDKIS